MSKYDVKAVVCDYGIFENNKLKIIVNSQANALLIKYVLEQDSQHKVVIADLLEKINKKKHKLKAMTCGEFCHKFRFCRQCPMYDEHIDDCITPYFRGSDLYRKQDGKYILVEVRE